MPEEPDSTERFPIQHLYASHMVGFSTALNRFFLNIPPRVVDFTIKLQTLSQLAIEKGPTLAIPSFINHPRSRSSRGFRLYLSPPRWRIYIPSHKTAPRPVGGGYIGKDRPRGATRVIDGDFSSAACAQHTFAHASELLVTVRHARHFRQRETPLPLSYGVWLENIRKGRCLGWRIRKGLIDAYRHNR